MVGIELILKSTSIFTINMQDVATWT